MPSRRETFLVLMDDTKWRDKAEIRTECPMSDDEWETVTRWMKASPRALGRTVYKLNQEGNRLRADTVRQAKILRRSIEFDVERQMRKADHDAFMKEIEARIDRIIRKQDGDPDKAREQRALEAAEKRYREIMAGMQER